MVEENKIIPETNYTTRTTCRVCNSPKLSHLFSLGTQFLNDFPTKENIFMGRKAPLDMIFCENCTLVQLKHTAPQELLYSRFYWYKSGVTETMKKALKEIAEIAEKRFNLKSGDVVLDIGSNDGTLLRQFTVPNLITVGIEPATNLAEEGKQGITHFINDFWVYDKYWSIVGKKAKIITALGMFYDMEDPNQFIADAAKALTEEGIFIAQLMCLKNMLDGNDVGNICVKPETLILGDNKQIKNVSVGSNSVGENGKIVKVKNTMKRSYQGDLINIKPVYLDPIAMTPEHPLKIVRKKYFRYGCGQTKPILNKYNLEWVSAGEVKRGDWVVVPKLKPGGKISSLDLTLFNQRDKKGYRGGLQSFPLNVDTAWLLGLYVAEGFRGGHYDNPYFSFSLHSKETYLANRVSSIMQTLGYKTQTILAKQQKGMDIRVVCAALTRALEVWCGKGALNKHIPDFILESTAEIKQSFLQGLFAGDGYIKKNKVHFHTSSKTLALQVQLLTASLSGMLGISYVKPYPRIIRGREVESKDSWQLRGSSKVLAHIFNYKHQGSDIHHVITTKDYILVPVKKVERESYNGFVHNIETEDNTYLVSNAVVHNCHEHLEYYSFSSLEYLFEKNGLEIFDIEINEVNGGSYRLYAKKKGAVINVPKGASERIAKVKLDEKDYRNKRVYLDFFQRLEKNKQKCVDFIKQETARGKKVWVYGASTKGNVILQYYELDHTLIEAASERSPWKFERYTVGTGIPILTEEEARKAQPDYFLVLPYAFFKEMYARETDWRRKGGKWIVPLPEFRIVD